MEGLVDDERSRGGQESFRARYERGQLDRVQVEDRQTCRVGARTGDSEIKGLVSQNRPGTTLPLTPTEMATVASMFAANGSGKGKDKEEANAYELPWSVSVSLSSARSSLVS